jgi:glycosyltransferase involved in cell wall biosynthesis
MTDKFITVVIPAKNESKVIKHAILRVLEAFEKY